MKNLNHNQQSELFKNKYLWPAIGTAIIAGSIVIFLVSVPIIFVTLLAIWSIWYLLRKIHKDWLSKLEFYGDYLSQKIINFKNNLSKN